MAASLFVLVLVLVAVTSQSPCGGQPSVAVLGGRELGDGGLVADDGTRFPPGCSWTTASSTRLGCVGSANPCVWKCCQQHHVIDESNACVSLNATSPPPLLAPQSVNLSAFTLLVGNPCPYQRYVLDADEPYVIADNLTLVVLVEGEVDFSTPAGRYCLEEFRTAGASLTLPVVCLDEEEYAQTQAEDVETHSAWLYSLGMIVSLPFLVATIAVYAVIPELNNLHGKCLVSHVASLVVGYVFLIVIKLLGKHVLSYTLCVVSALGLYFFFLSLFFWLNVMCFDIWWTFSGYRAVVGPRGIDEHRQFLLYSLYGWGIPLVMLCVCLVANFAPGLPDSFVRPMIGAERCWFEGRLPLLVYFYGPIGVLIASNIVMFVVTSWKIVRIRRETAILSVPDNRRSDEDRQNKQRFVLYLKLFVVMGVSWSLEPISWLVGGPAYMWWGPDLINALKGVFIFFIFVWKAKVRYLVTTRFKQTSRRFSATSTRPH